MSLSWNEIQRQLNRTSPWRVRAQESRRSLSELEHHVTNVSLQAGDVVDNSVAISWRFVDQIHNATTGAPYSETNCEAKHLGDVTCGNSAYIGGDIGASAGKGTCADSAALSNNVQFKLYLDDSISPPTPTAFQQTDVPNDCTPTTVTRRLRRRRRRCAFWCYRNRLYQCSAIIG